MEFLVLAFILAILAVGAAIASGNPSAWFREEWRRMNADTFTPELPGPTESEERAARLLLRQRALSRRMRREGKHLLSGKDYKPALTSPSERERTTTVVRFRRPA